MIQCYKINNLYVIEDTVRDFIYPNLTEEQAIAVLKAFGIELYRIDYAMNQEDYYGYYTHSYPEKLYDVLVKK